MTPLITWGHQVWTPYTSVSRPVFPCHDCDTGIFTGIWEVSEPGWKSELDMDETAESGKDESESNPPTRFIFICDVINAREWWSRDGAQSGHESGQESSDTEWIWFIETLSDWLSGDWLNDDWFSASNSVSCSWRNLCRISKLSMRSFNSVVNWSDSCASLNWNMLRYVLTMLSYVKWVMKYDVIVITY